MRVVVQDWFHTKAQGEASRYNRTLLWKKVYERHERRLPEDIGDRFVKDGDEDIKLIGIELYGEKLRETEKAVQYNLKYWNLRKAGRYVTDAPIESGWKLWIPKSLIIEEVS